MNEYLFPTRLGRLHVRVTGTGPLVVLWHSMFVDSSSWDRVVPMLAASRTLHLVDAPSCGSSDPLSEAADISACADAAVELLEEMQRRWGFDSVDWVGNAWGGHVGMEVAARRPDLIATLVAISAPTHPIDTALRRKVRMLLPLFRLVGLRGPVRSAIEDTIFTDHTRAHDPEAARLLRDAIGRAGRRATALAIETAILDRTDLVWAARALTCPTLFVTTDDRGEWTPEEARAVVATMANAREATVHGARVIPAWEQPEQLADIVTEFWTMRADVRRARN
ncbi:alpha/beta fold hydrolase [Rhodococcus fascians]|nr:alpha/beta fold hydrolase [Rhodococcus fascians]